MLGQCPTSMHFRRQTNRWTSPSHKHPLCDGGWMTWQLSAATVTLKQAIYVSSSSSTHASRHATDVWCCLFKKGKRPLGNSGHHGNTSRCCCHWLWRPGLWYSHRGRRHGSSVGSSSCRTGGGPTHCWCRRAAVQHRLPVLQTLVVFLYQDVLAFQFSSQIRDVLTI